jgi:hypothetical protein
MSRDLEDSADVEEETAKHEGVFASKLFSNGVAEDGTKETSSLESADDVGLEGRKFVARGRGESKGRLERRQSERAADEGRVIPKHGGAHGGRQSEGVYPPIVHLAGCRIGGVVHGSKPVTHGEEMFFWEKIKINKIDWRKERTGGGR